MIHPVGGAVHHLNNWGMSYKIGQCESGLNTRDARDTEETWHAGVTKNYEAYRVSHVPRISRDLCIRDDSQSIVRELYVDDTFQNVCLEVIYFRAKYLLDISPLTGREGHKHLPLVHV